MTATLSRAPTHADDGNAFTRNYTWGLDLSGSMQGAGGIGGLLAMHQGGSDYAYAYDGNGNVIALISTDGTTSAHFEYSPFGEQLRATGPAAESNRFRFSTKWADQDTGWLYYGYRWMEPGTGRFLNRDRIEEAGGLNLYAFTLNNPVSSIDLLGDVTLVEALLGAVVIYVVAEQFYEWFREEGASAIQRIALTDKVKDELYQRGVCSGTFTFKIREDRGIRWPFAGRRTYVYDTVVTYQCVVRDGCQKIRIVYPDSRNQPVLRFIDGTGICMPGCR